MKLITIMADFGMGPYAWDGGTCIAAAVGGFAGSGFSVSPELEKEFADWSDTFEGYFLGSPLQWDDPEKASGFGWDVFHRSGIELCRRLKAELGDQARVMYCKPIEDPSTYITGRGLTEIMPDGTLLQVELPHG